MSTFHLSNFDELILKQIVKKFTSRSGANFYRSCRGAKELVDFVKPAWLPPDLPYAILCGYNITGRRDWERCIDYFMLMDLRTYKSSRVSLALPYEAARVEMAFLNGEIYIFGGWRRIYRGPLHVLKVAFKLKKNLEWEQLPDMIEEHHAWVSACSVVFDGCIWLMGGANIQNGYYQTINSVEAYSPATNFWTRKPSMNQKRSDFAAAVANGKLFVCGGLDIAYCLRSVEYYDSQLETWIFCTPLPSPRYALAAVVHGSRLIVLGGDLSYPMITSDVLSMDLDEAEPQWTRMPKMDGGRFQHSAIMFGGNLLVANGFRKLDDEMLAVEIFDGKTWRTEPEICTPAGPIPSTSISEELAHKLLTEYSNH